MPGNRALVLLVALTAAPALAWGQRGPGAPSPQRKPPRSPGTYVTLRTGRGDIVLRMLPELAPQTVAHFVALAEGSRAFRDHRTGQQVLRPFYDGLTFHRVIPNVLIQGGDPEGDGTGGPGFTIPDEPPPGGTVPHGYVRGAVLMSHRARPNSAGSQFFILLADLRSQLPPGYTVFGEVVGGMDVAEAISAAERRPNRFRPSERSTPVHPVSILKAVVSRVERPDGAPPAAAAGR